MLYKVLCHAALLSFACLSSAVLAAGKPAIVVDTCTGTYPSYWQDLDPKFRPMWQGQNITNAPTGGYTGPVFKLSDKFPRQPVDDRANQPWRAAKFDALFDPATDQKTKAKLAHEYAWSVLKYSLEGNINQPGQEDFAVCRNPVRPWFHIPFQTYDAMSGREFTHGLTREAPVTFSVNAGSGTDPSTIWAVAIYNPTAAYTLGQVWQKNGEAIIPTANLSFDDGAVVAKPLFNTSTVAQLPVLANMPSWDANISDPAFCGCKAEDGGQCSLIEESRQCPRSYAIWNNVRLLQLDISIKDSRAPDTGWVYGTFVADGLRKAHVAEPWHRVSLLGLMWGNDTPPKGQLAYNYPPNPRKNGFKEEVIFWDVVDELNKHSGTASARQMGHLGSNSRLNGPADDANSSCMSCHGTASVPDSKFNTPPLVSQFSSSQTKQGVAPFPTLPRQGLDRLGGIGTELNGVTFAELDALYFANVPAATSFNMTAQTVKGPVNIMGEGIPSYSDGTRKWISLDYSLQLSISLSQWMQWKASQALQAIPAASVKPRSYVKPLRRNKVGGSE